MRRTTFKKDFKTGKQCWHSHKPIVFTCSKGKAIILLGGSATYPPASANVYVSLLESGRVPVVEYQWPWVKDKDWIHFPIVNMGVSHVKPFKSLIVWLARQARAGKVIHVGCFGGHGRTGMVLAALYKQLTGDPDATNTIRKLYCEKAVESQIQVDFLYKHYSIIPAIPRFSNPETSTKVSTRNDDIMVYDPPYTSKDIIKRKPLVPAQHRSNTSSKARREAVPLHKPAGKKE